MNRTALPSDLRSGGDGDGVGVGVGTGATTDALAFTGANDEAGTVDALTSGVINLGRGAVAVAEKSVTTVRDIKGTLLNSRIRNKHLPVSCENRTGVPNNYDF